MSPEQVKKAVDNYSTLLQKKQQLHERIIKQSGGRNPEREAAMFHRLKTIERQIELIHYAIDSDAILTTRENYAIYARTEGFSCEEIADTIGITRRSVSTLLNTCYEKISSMANERAV